MNEEAGVEPASPAAAIMSRRESRTAIPERLKVAARDDSSDDEWDPDEAAGASHGPAKNGHKTGSSNLYSGLFSLSSFPQYVFLV